MSETPLSPQERVEGIFQHLHEVCALEALGDSTAAVAVGQETTHARVDTMLERHYREIGALMLPEGEAALLADPRGWERIRAGTALYRQHMRFLLGKDPHHCSENVRDELIATAHGYLQQHADEREAKLINKHPLIGTLCNAASVSATPRSC